MMLCGGQDGQTTCIAAKVRPFGLDCPSIRCLFNNALFFNVLKSVSLSTGSPVVTQNVSKSAEQPRAQPGIDFS